LIVKAFSAFIRPVRHPILTPFCTELTTITQEDVDGAGEFPEAFASFRRWAVGWNAFASWGKFDLDQFRRDCDYHGMEFPFGVHLNLSRVFTMKYGRKMGNRRAMKKLGLKPGGTHHRGIDDARNIASMLPFLVN
jgi:inhibitor of KinA sporulation pathway (predicted exonuclease)